MKLKHIISVCGIDCADHYHCNKCSGVCKKIFSAYDNHCEGCDDMHKKIISNSIADIKICSIYKCVYENNLKHCGECEQLPCELFYEMQDPLTSDEQHHIDIAERVIKLNTMKNNDRPLKNRIQTMSMIKDKQIH